MEMTMKTAKTEYTEPELPLSLITMERYDAVIIGGGLGGLASGYMLAKEGLSVCILEKNRQFGGCLQTFSRDKAIFDTGVHYIGGLDEGQNLHRYFTYLGLMDQLKLRRMDEEGFDRITFGGETVEYPHAIGCERFVENLAQYFPNARTELKAYCRKLQDICDTFPLYRVREAEPGADEVLYAGESTVAFLEETISDPRLRQVLAGSSMLYAGTAEKSALHQHALIVNSYLESAWKCVDGGSQITKILVKNIREAGGTLINYAEVKRLHTENRVVEYALLEDGQRIYGKQFISNIHPALTLEMMDAELFRPTYRNRILSLENTISAFSLHLVFEPEQFPYLNYNIYHHRYEDTWKGVQYTMGEWPPFLMISTPASSKSEQFAESMTVMVYMHYEDVKPWADTLHLIPQHDESRGAAYEEFKAACSDKIMQVLESRFPGIRQKVRSLHASTPLSYRDYIGTPGGSMYGIMKDYANLPTTTVSHKTKVANLLFTGQNLNTHGILGVTVSAVKTAGELVGQNYLIRKINAPFQ